MHFLLQFKSNVIVATIIVFILSGCASIPQKCPDCGAGCKDALQEARNNFDANGKKSERGSWVMGGMCLLPFAYLFSSNMDPVINTEKISMHDDLYKSQYIGCYKDYWKSMQNESVTRGIAIDLSVAGIISLFGWGIFEIIQHGML